MVFPPKNRDTRRKCRHFFGYPGTHVLFYNRNTRFTAIKLAGSVIPRLPAYAPAGCRSPGTEPGNAIELGYALQSEIHDLVFEDCDIIHCQYEGNMGGAAISIHQADGGHVHDIHYKNIRVEQAEQKLFDIKVLLCKYTEQLAKGEINDIYFDNIQVLNGDIPVSVIRGYQTPTEEVRVHDVHFDNITFMGNKCETWQDMRLVTELANDIYVNGVRTCRQMKF